MSKVYLGPDKWHVSLAHKSVQSLTENYNASSETQPMTIYTLDT